MSVNKILESSKLLMTTSAKEVFESASLSQTDNHIFTTLSRGSPNPSNIPMTLPGIFGLSFWNIDPFVGQSQYPRWNFVDCVRESGLLEQT